MAASSSPDADLFVDPDIRTAETLPPSAFTDPAFLAREQATLFHDAWHLIPERPGAVMRDDPRTLADLVRRRGAQTPVTLGDAPLFLQRDWDGGLHLFPNVCTHAWHTLVQGPGRERAIVCPQHGRRYDTTGTCTGAPGFDGHMRPDGTEWRPDAADHLTDLPVHGWGPFFFASLGAPDVPFEPWIRPVTESLGALDLDALRRRPLDHEVRDLPGNWKQHAWNYLDTLHIPFIHSRPGGLAEAIDLDTYRTEPYPDSVLQWAYARDPAHGFDPGLLAPRFRQGDRRVYALWWFLFPNLTLNLYPWGLSVNLYRPDARDPQRTRFHWYHHVLDETKYADQEKTWMLRSVDDEDVDALSQVGRGVRSGLARRGRFAPEAEQGPHWFHRRVYEAVARGPGTTHTI